MTIMQWSGEQLTIAGYGGLVFSVIDVGSVHKSKVGTTWRVKVIINTLIM